MTSPFLFYNHSKIASRTWSIMKEVDIMKWYISLYKNLPDELKMDCDKKRGLYIVKNWTKHTTSVCPFSIGNFVNVIFKKDVSW